MMQNVDGRARRRRPVQDTVETDSNLSIRFWMQELMVTRNELLSTVATVGRNLSAVRAFLANETRTVIRSRDRMFVDKALPGRKVGTLCRVQYVSRAASSLSALDVDAILSWSRQYNRAEEISGVLLFTGRHFSQILEGTPATVHALFRSIRVDPRHHDVRLLADVAIADRDFNDWSMAWVQNFGLRDLLEELWWAATGGSVRASERAAELLRHLRHAVCDGQVAVMQDAGSPSTSSPTSGSTR